MGVFFSKAACVTFGEHTPCCRCLSRNRRWNVFPGSRPIRCLSDSTRQIHAGPAHHGAAIRRLCRRLAASNRHLTPLVAAALWRCHHDLVHVRARASSGYCWAALPGRRLRETSAYPPRCRPSPAVVGVILNPQRSGSGWHVIHPARIGAHSPSSSARAPSPDCDETRWNVVYTILACAALGYLAARHMVRRRSRFREPTAAAYCVLCKRGDSFKDTGAGSTR